MKERERKLNEISNKVYSRLKRIKIFTFLTTLIAIALTFIWGFYSVTDIKKVYIENTQNADNIKNLKKQKVEFAENILSLKPLICEDKVGVKKRREIIGIQRKAENAKYLVGFYSLKAHEDDLFRTKIKDYFLKEGYTLFVDYNLEYRPSWFSLQSTIFHYHQSSIKHATYISENLLQNTGIYFKVQKGAGLGVTKGEEEITFYIHYIPKQN